MRRSPNGRWLAAAVIVAVAETAVPSPPLSGQTALNHGPMLRAIVESWMRLGVALDIGSPDDEPRGAALGDVTTRGAPTTADARRGDTFAQPTGGAIAFAAQAPCTVKHARAAQTAVPQPAERALRMALPSAQGGDMVTAPPSAIAAPVRDPASLLPVAPVARSPSPGLTVGARGPPTSTMSRSPAIRLAAAHASAAPGAAPSAASANEGRSLIERLGCPVCHDIPGHSTTVRHQAPDLTWEGDRVRPEWLFAFLKAPSTIRPALTARMPNFRLTDEEALAITEALRGFKDGSATPLPPAQQYRGAPSTRARDAAQKLTSKDYLDCFSCHGDGERNPAGKQEERGPDLSRAPQRLNPDWIVRWLADPSKIVPGTKMPAFFADDKSGPDDILDGDEMAQMMALRDWLVSRGSRDPEPAYEAARGEHPDAGPALGRSLLVRLNCVGCHRIAGFPEGRRVGPHLGFQGTRVTRAWLREFLRRPELIKPEYAIMGSDARMPDFRLSEKEVDLLVDYIATNLVDPAMPASAAGMFDRALVPAGERLFAEKFCDNCHRIDRRPGGIGPDLTLASRRLNPVWIYRFVLNPSHYLDTRMPNLKLTDTEARAVTSYLLHREPAP